MKVFRWLFAASLLFALLPQEILAQQVKAYSYPSRGGTHFIGKEVKKVINPKIEGAGVPTQLFVVQLARFEEMASLPATFPKGTILWVNPDVPTEKILYSGFYESLADAKKAAVEWKKIKEFKSAFARPMPWLVRYD
ncbi:MAG: hypothetical protein AAFP92_10585 [Bacteroidota bacterium]